VNPLVVALVAALVTALFAVTYFVTVWKGAYVFYQRHRR
jgi:hypothetical protein